MLSIANISKNFGGVKALEGISFTVSDGEVVGVIGPNGSGKSTLINVLTGFYTPSAGTITLDGDVISGSAPDVIRNRNIVRTFQNLRLVDEMTVIENVVAGLHTKYKAAGGTLPAFIRSLIGLPGAAKLDRECQELARTTLALVGLAGREEQKVGSLSYAEQKRLEIARSIVLRPRYLILDEPTAGMGVAEADALIRMIIKLAKDGPSPMSVFLVEHRLELVLEVSDRTIVMDGGCLVADGVPSEIAADQNVRRIYVGGE